MPASGGYCIQNLANLAATSSASAWGIASWPRVTQLRQLGDIGRDPPRNASAAQRLNNTAFLAAPLSNVPVVHMGQTACKCACKMADEPANSRHYSGGGLHHTSADEHGRCDDEPAAHCPSGDGSAPSPEKHPQSSRWSSSCSAFIFGERFAADLRPGSSSIDYASFCPALITTKHACNSSTDQGGGKRRIFMLGRLIKWAVDRAPRR